MVVCIEVMMQVEQPSLDGVLFYVMDICAFALEYGAGYHPG